MAGHNSVEYLSAARKKISFCPHDKMNISSLSEGCSIDEMLDAIKHLLGSQSVGQVKKAPLVSVVNEFEKERIFVTNGEIESYSPWNHSHKFAPPVLTECRTRCSTSSESEQLESPRDLGRMHSGHIPLWEQQAPYNTMTLPDVFKLLQYEDEDCIICVKKIHKLGFKSVKMLRQYFSQFGGITRVVVLPSRQKEIGCYDGTSRFSVRPASMCFIVMSNRLACRRILMQELHYVGGEWPVEVSVFNKGASNSPHDSYISSSTAVGVSY